MFIYQTSNLEMSFDDPISVSSRPGVVGEYIERASITPAH